jgi:beta-lactam-binding protein with PASTA domain
MAFRRRYRRSLPPSVPPSEQPTTVIEDGPFPPGPPGPPVAPDRYWWPWLVVLLVLLAIGGGLAAYFATSGDGGKKVVVPRAVGLQEPSAAARIEQRGLKVRTSREFSSKPFGIVVAQSPGAGSQLRKGDVVALIVSKGPHAVAVPNLVSVSEADAVAQLTDAGLKADVVQVPSSQRPGTVVAQNPVGGTSVDPGSTVRLNVSKGRTHTTTVTTTTQTTATATTATTTTHTTTTTQTTTTTAQATVPGVVGSGLPDAVAQMKAAGLLADSYPVTSEDPGGTVVAQNPTAGASVDAGSIVRLNVSTGTTRPPLPVPDVTGATQATARRDLSKTFTVRTVYRSGQAGVVVGQLPNAGAKAKRWAQVIIYVGR